MLPNFLILGAMKAGTTALHHALAQHPQIYMSLVKEPHFFSYLGRSPSKETIVTTIEGYNALFDGVTSEIARGESSPTYLASEEAPSHIRDYIPDVKMIAILRDPVDRAYSNYWHDRQEGREKTTDFLTAFRENYERRLNTPMLWGSYRVRGYYHQQLTHYFKFFAHDQFRIFLYEDWNKQPDVMLHEVFNFLGVDSTFEARNERYIRTGDPKNRRLYNFLRHPPKPLRNLVNRILPKRLTAYRQKLYLNVMNDLIEKPPAITPDERAAVLEVYRDEILALQDLIERDLSAWLRVEREKHP